MKTILLIFLLVVGIHITQAQTTSKETVTIEGIWIKQKILDTLGNSLDSVQLREVYFNHDTLNFSADTSTMIPPNKGEPPYMNLYHKSNIPKKGFMYSNFYSFNPQKSIVTLARFVCGIVKYDYQIISLTDKEIILKFHPDNTPWSITEEMPFVVHYKNGP